MDGAADEILSTHGYHPSKPGEPFAYARDDMVLELKSKLGNVRDLLATILQLAHAVRDARGKQAVLLLIDPRISRERLAEEWKAISQLLRPSVWKCLHLVVADAHAATALSGSGELAQLGREVREALEAGPSQRAPVPEKAFGVLKVLVNRWLLGLGPISRKQLAVEARCSYPTVANALDELERYLEPHKNRSAELRSLPQRRWAELLVRTRQVRQTQVYVDPSHQTQPDFLRRRLEKLAPVGVFLGGAAAAAHWDPDVDLHGLPRLDVSLGPGSMTADALARRLDPALQLAGDPQEPGVFVTHVLGCLPTYAHAEQPLSLADPVETVLDMHELRLAHQADQVMSTLRSRHG